MDEVIEVVDTKEQVDEIMKSLAVRNTLKYNQTKAAEECAELSLVMLQSANKKGKHVPEKQEIIDEIGDVWLRIGIIMLAMDISEEEIQKRIFHKANKYSSWLKSGEYNGGI